MKVFTIATKSEGYFDLLKSSTEKWGYQLHALGWNQPWQGFAWKLELYIEAFKKLPPKEVIICVDGYDVIAVGPPNEIDEKFKQQNCTILFSGQRYFPGQKWIRKLADKVMAFDESKYTETTDDTAGNAYTRPCMGLLIGYAENLLFLFEQLMEIEKEKSINDDQTLLNIFYTKNPNALQVDRNCNLFQNLWRTRGGLYGKISSKDTNAEINLVFDEENKAVRVRNKAHGTQACFIHGPLNLNMDLLLKELGLPIHNRSHSKNIRYWQYSILHHVKRAIGIYLPFNK